MSYQVRVTNTTVLSRKPRRQAVGIIMHLNNTLACTYSRLKQVLKFLFSRLREMMSRNFLSVILFILLTITFQFTGVLHY